MTINIETMAVVAPDRYHVEKDGDTLKMDFCIGAVIAKSVTFSGKEVEHSDRLRLETLREKLSRVVKSHFDDIMQDEVDAYMYRHGLGRTYELIESDFVWCRGCIEVVHDQYKRMSECHPDVRIDEVVYDSKGNVVGRKTIAGRR